MNLFLRNSRICSEIEDMKKIPQKLWTYSFKNIIELFSEELRIVYLKFPNYVVILLTRIYWEYPETSAAQIIVVIYETLWAYVPGESHS